MYPRMIEQLLGSVHCFSGLADGPGDVIVSRLRSHPDILCEDASYKLIRNVVCIPAIIIWVIILPLYTIKRFFDEKQDIYNS
jgi:hypothetical protein